MYTIIFTIPVYSMTEENFKYRWEKKIEAEIQDFISNGWACEEATRTVYSLHFPNIIWKYNQIVGHVEISAQNWSVFYDLYIPINKSFKYCRKSITFSQAMGLNGWHFYVNEKQTNAEIAVEMKNWLYSLQREHIPEGLYLDTSTFESQINFLDIKSLLKSLS